MLTGIQNNQVTKYLLKRHRCLLTLHAHKQLSACTVIMDHRASHPTSHFQCYLAIYFSIKVTCTALPSYCFIGDACLSSPQCYYIILYHVPVSFAVAFISSGGRDFRKKSMNTFMVLYFKNTRPYIIEELDTERS